MTSSISSVLLQPLFLSPILYTMNQEKARFQRLNGVLKKKLLLFLDLKDLTGLDLNKSGSNDIYSPYVCF